MSYNPSDPLGLSKSQARRALMAIFFTNSEQEYFPRQLERMTGIYVANLQRELVRMEGSGILGARRLGKMKLYRLNKAHPLYPEMKGLVAKTVGLEEMIRGTLGALDGIKAACIYGSFARSEQRASSDIDVLILGEVEKKPLIQAMKELEKKLQREVNYSLYSPEEWRRNRARKDPFVMEVLRRPRIHLIGDPDAIR